MSEQTAIDLPADVKTVVGEREAIEARIRALEITNQDQYNEANAFLKEVKAKIKMIEDQMLPIKKSAYGAYLDIMKLIKNLTEPFVSFETIVKAKIGFYLQAQEKIRKAEEEVRRKMIEEQRIKDAEALVAQGKPQEADAVLEKKMVVPKSEPIDKGGTYIVETWRAEIVDFKALVNAVAEGKADLMLLAPNQSALNKMAGVHKDGFNIPGVKAISETSVRSRG